MTLLFCAASATRVTAQAPTQHASSVASFPDTPIGRLGRALIETINSGDSTAQADFVTRHVSETAIKESPVAQRAAWLARVGEQSGGLHVVEAAGSDPLEIVVKTRRGPHWARIYAFADPRQQDRLGHRLTAAARRDEFSGVVLVAKGDRTIFHRAYGLADRSWRIPNRLDTKFNLASMNKMFTAVAIAQLVAAGKLHFEDTLGTVSPDYPNQDAARTITIAQLLSHSAASACCSTGRISIGESDIAPPPITSRSSPANRCSSSPVPRRPIATKGSWYSARSWRNLPV